MPETDPLDRERLVRVTNQMIETITAPEFVERMREARESADKGGGFDTAGDLLSVRSLREAGVDIPDDLRVTSRVFEDHRTGLDLNIRTAPLDPQAGPLGWGVCAGGGGDEFCGCAGFST